MINYMEQKAMKLTPRVAGHYWKAVDPPFPERKQDRSWPYSVRWRKSPHPGLLRKPPFLKCAGLYKIRLQLWVNSVAGRGSAVGDPPAAGLRKVLGKPPTPTCSLIVKIEKMQSRKSIWGFPICKHENWEVYIYVLTVHYGDYIDALPNVDHNARSRIVGQETQDGLMSQIHWLEPKFVEK